MNTKWKTCSAIIIFVLSIGWSIVHVQAAVRAGERQRNQQNRLCPHAARVNPPLQARIGLRPTYHLAEPIGLKISLSLLKGSKQPVILQREGRVNLTLINEASGEIVHSGFVFRCGVNTYEGPANRHLLIRFDGPLPPKKKAVARRRGWRFELPADKAASGSLNVMPQAYYQIPPGRYRLRAEVAINGATPSSPAWKKMHLISPSANFLVHPASD